MSLSMRVASRLVDQLGVEKAQALVAEYLGECSNIELAAHENDWEETWAREKQLPPKGDWVSWGFLTGRGFGKTLAISKYINGEVFAGRAPLICLVAQDEQSAIDIMVKGPSGLIATAPHWFRPEWLASEMQLVWPNGSRAYVRTPEVPGKIRGLEYHISWISEVQSWPVATREESYRNILLSTRLGYARICWDATPKKRHPLLKKLLARAEDPRHVVVRGATHENPFLADGYVEQLTAELGGTQGGREELLGEMLDDSDSALIKADWIERNRRRRPTALTKRVIAVDPAVTTRGGSDQTGISDVGLADGQCLVLGDYTGKYTPGEWAAIVLDKYSDGCDLVIVETNKGGQLLSQNLRAAAKDRNLRVEVLGKEEAIPGRVAGVVFVREVFGRGSKEDRAQPLATAYERNRVSHAIGANLEELEDVLTTWEPVPGARSPDRLDPLVYAVVELLGLSGNRGDPKAGFVGVVAAAEAINKPEKAGKPSNISTLLGWGSGGRGGGRI